MERWLDLGKVRLAKIEATVLGGGGKEEEKNGRVEREGKGWVVLRGR